MIKRTPVITIIGIPNTGKSTLFNRIVGKRKALVHSDPGMTRDIYQKTFEYHDKAYILQDTGGFFLEDDVINLEINKRVLSAAEQSDLIIFLFDGRRDLLGYEKDLYLEVKKLNSNILAAVNKVDQGNLETFLLPANYYSLKLDFLCISAEHNLGIENLLESIEDRLVEFKGREHQESIYRISFIGKPNVGKSSLINQILDRDQIIVTPYPGTTRDSVEYQLKRNKNQLILVDNAGIRKWQKIKESTESAAIIRAERDIKKADIIIFVLDISRKMDQNDLMIARSIEKSAKPLVIACNKWDLIDNKNQANQYLKKVKRRFQQLQFAPLHLVSAKTGKGIFSVLDDCARISASLSSKLKTSRLNELVNEILKERKFYTLNNRPFNPKFFNVESMSPFFIRFYTSTPSRLKSHCETYVKRRILEELGFVGIPVFFKIMASKAYKKQGIKKSGK